MKTISSENVLGHEYGKVIYNNISYGFYFIALRIANHIILCNIIDQYCTHPMQQNDPSISFSDTLVCNNKPSVTYCLFLQCEPFKTKGDYKRNWHTGKGVHNIVYMHFPNILYYYYGSNSKSYIKVGVSFK